MARGSLVAFEGIDGAGTTSQLQPVAQALRHEGYTVVVTHEPSRGEVGTLLRRYLAAPSTEALPASEDTLALLFAADRLDHLQRTIEPALSNGAIVLCDRYLWSSYAYQTAHLPEEWVGIINNRARRADLNVLFTLPREVAERRRALRGGVAERFEYDQRQFTAWVNYEVVAGLAAPETVLTIDASAPIADVTQSIAAALVPWLKKRGRLP